MRKKKFAFWSIILALLLVFTGAFALSTNSVNAAGRTRVVKVSRRAKRRKKAKQRRPLIVVFSSKTAYDQNNLPVGHTMVIARDIQKRTHATLYEIRPAQAYPNDYQQLVRVAQRQRDENARPAIAGKLPNFKKYRTIFVGSPIWWGTYPMVVRSFFDQARSMNGKTLIPFSTSAGSGLGDQPQVLKRAFPRSKVRSGFTVAGTDANRAATRVNTWLRRLGY